MHESLSVSALISKQMHQKDFLSDRRCDINQLTTGVCLTVRVPMCTQGTHDLQWFPSGRCCCRNRASSQTDKGDPGEGCPSAERRSSLRKETGTENRSGDKSVESGITSTIQEVHFLKTGVSLRV